MGKSAVAERTEEQQKEELLFPEVSPDHIEAGGKRWQIRQLPFVYEKQVLQLLRPSIRKILASGEAEWLDLLMDEAQECLPDIVAVIFRVTDEHVTKKWVEENVTLRTIWKVVRLQLEKNELMDLVTDFFQRRGAPAALLGGRFPSTPSSPTS